ncbi:winged helix-turn-helix domain-containing protein [Tenacibaculum jejuense]|uniref:winged helix-turn-helix domain-containing protein n=1 Tax=Tenacibaculum jejuense TaxID=584609 RepID=UPI0012FE0473|nr:winged helix-turn-helix domain-containing protein [Tenacibaculum jejuense]
MSSVRIIVLLFTVSLISCNSSSTESYFSEIVKVSIRQVGHEILAANKDLTSPVLPVKKVDNATYEIAFPSAIEIEPDKLVKLIETNFKKAKLPEAYIVQVFQCVDNEVAYSYFMKKRVQEGIIPCANRILAKSCYTIRINFTEDVTMSSTNYKSYYIIIVLLIVVTIILLLLFKRKQQRSKNTVVEHEVKLTIGNYSFLPDRNILIRNSNEMNLSKKECDLLLILVENLNQTVKREELTKKVWEDNGVVVSRSLDTYISKLRKKLAEDETIKITNVHGVGYKLIVK